MPNTRCRRRDDAIFTASPPDVYSFALMTKTSSKVLGRFPTRLNLLRADRATGKRIAKQSDFTLDKSSPDLTGAQVTRPYKIKQQAFGGGAYSCVNNVSTQAPPPKAFGGGACVYHEHFGGGGACVGHGHLGEELIHVAM
jgi:hypothetical protein